MKLQLYKIKKIFKFRLTKRESYLLTTFAVLFLILLLGSALNRTAIEENNGKMPVLTSSDYETKTHFSFQDPEEINYYVLSDIIYIGKKIYSVGDVLLLVGFLFLLLFFILMAIGTNNYFKHRKKFCNIIE